MKIILTGATGFVGAEVLSHLMEKPEITQVTCLSRREVSIQSPKLKTIIHDDFSEYDDALLNRLSDHSACIWALGGKASDLGEPKIFERITHDFTLAFAKGVALHAKQPFTFCYLSGMGADPTETAWFPWEKLTRHLKGRTEKDLLLLQEQYPDFSVHCFRPGGILPHGLNFWTYTPLAHFTINVGALADAMFVAATKTELRRKWPIIENGAIKKLAP